MSLELHDRLEAIADLRQLVGLVYRNETGERVRVQAKLDSLYTEAHGDYCRLSNGLIIRLDRLESVRIDGMAVWG